MLQGPYTRLEDYRAEFWMPGDGRPVGGSLSGGRSSAKQAAHIIEANGGSPPGLIWHFQNTGREDPRTLKFVDRLDRELDLDLHWLERDSTHPDGVRRVTFETASREGEPFLQLLYEIVAKRRDGTAGVRPTPNPVQRTCTGKLKINTWHRYARRVLGWPTQYWDLVGYRSEERGRLVRALRQQDKKNWPEGGRGLFPMYWAGHAEEDVLWFWDHASFNLELPSTFGNCDYCFMVSTWKLKERMLLECLETGTPVFPGAEPPPRLRFWIAVEERRSDRPTIFRDDRPTYRQLWEEVCAGHLGSSIPEAKDDVCQSCAD